MIPGFHIYENGNMIPAHRSSNIIVQITWNGICVMYLRIFGKNTKYELKPTFLFFKRTQLSDVNYLRGFGA